MNKKKLFYKAIIWNIIGLVITSIISFLWFGNWIQSLSFSLILIIISIFTYVLYEIVWIKLSKKMKKINLTISGCMGRMGQQLIKSSKKNKNFKLVALTENRLVNKKFNGIKPELNSDKAFKKTDVIIDFTVPNCTLEILKIASKLRKKVVIGTTGFTRSQENQIKKYSKKIPILKAGNMSLGVNLLMYLTEIASKSLNDEYLSKIFEVHHKHKKDYPSGTALMLGKGIADGKNKNLYNLIGKKFLNKKSFPYGKKINFNSIRKGEIIGEHEVKFSSGKEIITLNHEAFDRALYSDGALTASKWLMKKKSGLYSMRDLLNFS